MIPKIIHYCWLSNDPYPAKIRKCMDTWKKVMPDYELKLWNTENFDIDNAPTYVKEAVKSRKWAFAADYIRIYALYTEGGFYLDSDVKILKRFDDFREYNFISSMEYHPAQIMRDGSAALINGKGERIADKYVSGIQIQAAVMGAQKGTKFLKEVLDWYETGRFIRDDGTLAMDLQSPQIYARIAERYGFLYKDNDQHLADNIMIFRSEIFAGNKHETTPASYAIHLCAHSWKGDLKERLKRRIVRLIKRIRP